MLVQDYNPNWPLQFVNEAKYLKVHLAENLIKIEHAGSTSVQGLSAKPEIDIICKVNDLNKARQLTKHGYNLKGEFNIPNRHFFSKNTQEYKINLHIFAKDNPVFEQMLAFRNCLRSSADLKNQYQELKIALAADKNNYQRIDGFSKYTHLKNSFIKSALAKADFKLPVLNFCCFAEEWQAYHQIKEQVIFKPLNIKYDPNHFSITDKNHKHLILYKAEKIVAIAHLELTKDFAVLRAMAVQEDFQGQGFGRKLLLQIESWLKMQEIQELKMHARLTAEKFYRKHGYLACEFNDESIQTNYINLGKKF